MNFEHARKNMVDCRLRPNKITASGVLSAFAQVPREQFLPPALKPLSYCDDAVHLGGERYMMPAEPTARLLQALEIQNSEHVLVIACTTGYEVAIAASLADMVIGLEDNEDMIASATVNLAQIDAANTEIHAGDLRLGVKSEAPFDAILLCGAAETIGTEIKAQLADKGRLVYVQKEADSPMGEARLIVRIGDSFAERGLFDTNLPSLQNFSKPKTFAF